MVTHRRRRRKDLLNLKRKGSDWNTYTMEQLHTYSDGSKLYKMSAKALTHIPIWKGNRIIDRKHVASIKQSIQDNICLLDSGYKTIQYIEYDSNNTPIKQTYIIDGQHRISIVSEYFESNPLAIDFYVTVTQIKVDSEADAIQYFNTINNVKPIQFEEDPNMVINKYIQGLCRTFNKNLPLIRPGATKRPYLSVDKLRDILVKKWNTLKNISVEVFVTKCEENNDIFISQLQSSSVEKDRKMVERMIQLHFALAWDDKWKWLDRIL